MYGKLGSGLGMRYEMKSSMSGCVLCTDERFLIFCPGKAERQLTGPHFGEGRRAPILGKLFSTPS